MTYQGQRSKVKRSTRSDRPKERKVKAVKVRNIILTILLVVLGSVTARGQLVWQISGNGALDKSYLFATNKLTDISFLDSIPNLFKVYTKCDKVITEFVMLDYEAIAALRTASLLPDSVRLMNFYTEDEYKEIDGALMATLGMGLQQLGRMKPQYLTEMYRTELFKQWAGYREDRSSEHFFEGVAQQQGKPVHGLDEIGEAMYMMFDREPFHWQCTELKKVIEYPEREVKQEKILRDLYKQGRLLDISYQVKGPDNQTTISFSDHKVYCDRNRTWVRRLEPYLREGKAFICLNAIYLGGEDGLIAQLQATGYRVKPVNKAKR